VNESPAEAVAREVREEAGLEVRAYKLAAVWDRARHPHGVAQPFHVWRLFFLCEITDGDPKPGPETSAKWLSLPNTSCRPIYRPAVFCFPN
jgi:ADP-ribose pyrophosphatase YjhB (NUDIX family)